MALPKHKKTNTYKAQSEAEHRCCEKNGLQQKKAWKTENKNPDMLKRRNRLKQRWVYVHVSTLMHMLDTHARTH